MWDVLKEYPAARVRLEEIFYSMLLEVFVFGFSFSNCLLHLKTTLFFFESFLFFAERKHIHSDTQMNLFVVDSMSKRFGLEHELLCSLSMTVFEDFK
jgi:hypothetical protein